MPAPGQILRAVPALVAALALSVGTLAPAAASPAVGAADRPTPVEDDLASDGAGTMRAVPAPEAVVDAQQSTAPATRDLTWTITKRLGERDGDWRLGSSWSGWVANTDGTRMWSKASTTTRLPASNEKVLTAYTALREIGGWRRLTTRAKQSSVEPSRIHLVGAGDPSLSSSRLRALAAQTAQALKAQRRSRVTVRVDDSLFPTPTNATGWKSSYVPDSVAPVRALVVDQRNVWDTSMDAGATFASSLRANGITVVGVSRMRTPRYSPTLASTDSAPVAALVRVMLNVSQNDYAEALHRLAARYAGRGTTWTAASRTVRARLVADGIPVTGLTVADGSGLSRANRMPVRTMTATLRSMDTRPGMREQVFAADGMPISGTSGTLYHRFRAWPSTCAIRIVAAKTGTLSDTYTLGGVAYSVDGRRRYFSFLVNHRTAATSTRAGLDYLATTVTGCA